MTRAKRNLIEFIQLNPALPPDWDVAAFSLKFNSRPIGAFVITRAEYDILRAKKTTIKIHEVSN